MWRFQRGIFVDTWFRCDVEFQQYSTRGRGLRQTHVWILPDSSSQVSHHLWIAPLWHGGNNTFWFLRTVVRLKDHKGNMTIRVLATVIGTSGTNCFTLAHYSISGVQARFSTTVTTPWHWRFFLSLSPSHPTSIHVLQNPLSQHPASAPFRAPNG